MLLILVVLISAGSGVYAGASFFAQQGPGVTVTTTLFTTTTSWTTSTIWSTVTEVVQGVLTTIEYTTSTSTVTVTGSPTTYAAYTGGSGNSGEPDASYVYAFPITLSAGETVQSIGVNWAGRQSGNVRVALYSAGPEKPANLLTESASTAVTQAAGWQDIPVAAYSGAAGTYWVAIQLSSSKSVYYQLGTRSYYMKGYGAFDSVWSSSSGRDTRAQWNMRVTCVGTLYDNNANSSSMSLYGHATGNFRLAIDSGSSGSPSKVLEWLRLRLP
jgi:hypothetical protein